ncbi:hypothetical protein [Cryptosporangium sp. NPDC048952]
MSDRAPRQLQYVAAVAALAAADRRARHHGRVEPTLRLAIKADVTRGC